MFIRLINSLTQMPVLIRASSILRVEAVETVDTHEDEHGTETETTSVESMVYTETEEIAVQEPLEVIDAMLADLY